MADSDSNHVCDGLLEFDDEMDTPGEAGDDDRYELNDNMGIALIFHKQVSNAQTTQRGTDWDVSRIEEAYKSYGFDVKIYKNLSHSEIDKILKNVSKEDHSKNDCFVVTVISYVVTGRITTKDNAFSVNRFCNPFLGERCPTLINKPKLFFIQDCLEVTFDEGVRFDDLTISLDTTNSDLVDGAYFTIPQTSDLLVMYSTFEGNNCGGNPANGLRFIQCLADELEASLANEFGTDLHYLLTSVTRSAAFYQSNVRLDHAMNHMIEMPSFFSTLTKGFTLMKKQKSDKV